MTTTVRRKLSLLSRPTSDDQLSKISAKVVPINEPQRLDHQVILLPDDWAEEEVFTGSLPGCHEFLENRGWRQQRPGGSNPLDTWLPPETHAKLDAFIATDARDGQEEGRQIVRVDIEGSSDGVALEACTIPVKDTDLGCCWAFCTQARVTENGTHVLHGCDPLLRLIDCGVVEIRSLGFWMSKRAAEDAAFRLYHYMLESQGHEFTHTVMGMWIKKAIKAEREKSWLTTYS